MGSHGAAATTALSGTQTIPPAEIVTITRQATQAQPRELSDKSHDWGCSTYVHAASMHVFNGPLSVVHRAVIGLGAICWVLFKEHTPSKRQIQTHLLAIHV